MAIEHAVRAAVATSDEPVSWPVLSRRQLVDRFVRDAGQVGVLLTPIGAAMIIDLWARAKEDADNPVNRELRGDRRIETLLTDDELEQAHAAMELLMPDDAPAVPGSAHQELDRYTFGVDQETGLARRGGIHTMDSTDACAVVVTVS